jgi:SAM-dependent methyltransferase
MAKYPRYQDYVIREGKFVGEFEKMYQDYDDPWEQSVKEVNSTDKAIAINLIKKVSANRVMEVGCGFGIFSNQVHELGCKALGVDISQTAIDKARTRYPDCEFVKGDLLDFDIYREFKPDVIVLAEITWYVLDKLDAFIDFLKKEMPDVYLIHLLTTYPVGVQKFGNEKFTNLSGILGYFKATYYEYGEITYPEYDDYKRTYFIGNWAV